MIRKIAEWMLRRRYLVLGIIAVITLYFIWEIHNIKIESRFADLLPQNHPFIKVHNQYKDQLGDPLKVFLMLKVKEGNIYNQQTLAKVQQITEALDFIPGVNHDQIYSIASRKVKKITVTTTGIITENFMNEVPKTKQEMGQFKETVLNTGSVYGIWVSPNEKAVLFSAGFIPERINYNVVFNKIQGIIQNESDQNHIIYAAGEPLLEATVLGFRNQIFLILGLSVFCIILSVYLYFRNLVGTLVPALCALLCAIWGLGFSGVIGDNLDPLGLVIPLLISARALSHSVQMTERYFEEYNEIGKVKEAIINAMYKNIPPGAVGIATDCLGILLIAVAPIPLIRKLGFVGAFWAGSNILHGLAFTPIMLSFFKPPKNIPDIVDVETGKVEKIIGVMAKAVSGRNCYRTFAVIVLIAAVAGYFGSQVKLGDINPGSPILWPDSDFNVAIGEINRNFPGVDELYVIVEGKKTREIANPVFMSFLNSFQRYMEKSPEVAATQSLADLIIPINKAVCGGYPKYEIIPLERPQIYQMYSCLTANSAPGDYDRFVSRDQRVANIIVWYKDHMGNTIRGAIASAKEFIEKNREMLKQNNIKFQLASGNIGILAAVNETVEDSQLLNFILIMVAYFALSTYTFRTIKCPLLLSVPLNMSNLITLAIMHFMGIGLNINTLPIVSLGIGVGDDYGLYIYSRIVEEYDKHKNYSDAFNVALKTSGKAVFLTASTMGAATIFWYFLSDLRFMAEMGLLLAFIMGLNMVLAMIVIPCLMYVFKFKPRYVYKEKE